MKPGAIKSLAYLATPYSKYPDGLERAFVMASKLAGLLIHAGVKIYSPIAHCHPVAIHGGLNPLDHDLWMRLDKAMMEACGALDRRPYMPRAGARSKGIAIEIDFFEGKLGQPIFDLDPLNGVKMTKRR